MARIRRTGRVPEFHWEHLEEFDKGVSEYKKFSIQVVSQYEWGKGWPNEEESRSFNIELAKKLGENDVLSGFIYTNPGDRSGTCPSIRGKRFSDKTDIYLHPMEFSGYATNEVIDELLSLLNSMNPRNVKHAEISYKREVSGMSNNEYKKLLIANTSNIARWQDAMFEAGYSKYDLGNKFAESFRIKRVGDKSGLSSSDLDWSFVDDLWSIRSGLLEYNLEKAAEELER